MPYIGGWKSIYYTLHVASEVGYKSFWKSIRSKNSCKTCAYGMGGQKGGMVNEVGEHLQICKKSMQAMKSDLQKPIPGDYFRSTNIRAIRALHPMSKEKLGRLNSILYKKPGDEKFSVLDWAQAYEIISNKLKATDAQRTFYYASGRSSNEAAFLLHLLARCLGTNNINNCSYFCHQASGAGLQKTIGSGTGTVQLQDLSKADCIFVIGANPSSNHPRFVTELLKCRRRGGKVVIINPIAEPGLKKFSIPSEFRSLMSGGSSIASHYYQPKVGGDWALLKGVAKYIIENGLVDEAFVDKYTEGIESYELDLMAETWEDIEEGSGMKKADIEEMAMLVVASKSCIFSWAMGITHHLHGVENVEAIVHLALLTGHIGRPGAGLLPLRGHSNVQGVGSMGVTPQLKKEVLEALEDRLDVDLPRSNGWDTMTCLENASQGEVDLAFVLGGNLLSASPSTSWAEEALNRIPFKVFLTTTINESHVHGVDEEVIILPVLTRDEERQKTSQESMFNYVRYSDGGASKCDNARSESDIICTLGQKIIPKSQLDFSPYFDNRSVRTLIGQVIPGFETMATKPDNTEFHIEGRTLHAPDFATPTGKARFITTQLNVKETRSLTLTSVRSEGQFNSIIYEIEDAWRGVKTRDVILMNDTDMKDRGLSDGDKVRVSSKEGEISGYTVMKFDVSRGTVVGYYPEMNVLIGREVDPQSKTPAFKNIDVEVQMLNS